MIDKGALTVKNIADLTKHAFLTRQLMNNDTREPANFSRESAEMMQHILEYLQHREPADLAMLPEQNAKKEQALLLLRAQRSGNARTGAKSF